MLPCLQCRLAKLVASTGSQQKWRLLAGTHESTKMIDARMGANTLCGTDTTHRRKPVRTAPTRALTSRSVVRVQSHCSLWQRARRKPDENFDSADRVRQFDLIVTKRRVEVANFFQSERQIIVRSCVG